MRELKIGERIPIEAGGEAVVSRELGRGGQGIVYLVRYILPSLIVIHSTKVNCFPKNILRSCANLLHKYLLLCLCHGLGRWLSAI